MRSLAARWLHTTVRGLSTAAPQAGGGRLPLLPKPEIGGAIESIVRKYVDMAGQDAQAWLSVHLANPSLKYQIVRDAMLATGRGVTNVELSNTFVVGDLVKLLEDKETATSAPVYSRTGLPRSFNAFESRNTVAEFLDRMREQSRLPANVSFVDLSPVNKKALAATQRKMEAEAEEEEAAAGDEVAEQESGETGAISGPQPLVRALFSA